MTAINLFVSPDKAFMISDRALMGVDGTFIAAIPKFAISRRLGMAIAYSGIAGTELADTLQSYLDARGTQRAAIGEIPALAAHLAVLRDNRMREYGMTAADAEESPGRLAVALWSQERDQPEAYIFCTGARGTPEGAPLNRLYGVRRLISPVPGAPYASPPTADTFDPARDVMPLLDAQRRSPDWSTCKVGGAIDVVTISRVGIERETLRPWRDVVGLPLGACPPAAAA